MSLFVWEKNIMMYPKNVHMCFHSIMAFTFERHICFI